MPWLDLHIHSKYSDDGEYSPEELISICVRAGVNTMAITDHNSTAAIPEAIFWADKLGVTLVPGIELDCTFREVGLHLLGYWIDCHNPVFARIEEDIVAQEQKAAAVRIAKARKLGIHVDAEAALDLARNGVVTGEIIAEVALQSAKNAGHPLLEPYRPGGKRGDNPLVNFYWDFCAQGKPAYVPIHFISLREAIETIESTGGIAVLAHPGKNISEDVSLLHAIIEQGISGLEAFSSYHTPEQTAFYLEQAEHANLAISCGSDFHGKTKPMITVGSVNCRGLETELLRGLMDKHHGQA